MPAISQAAIDLIVAAEVSSRAMYEKKYHRPEWPEGLSGVTVGIGYDLGYATKDKIEADWSGRIDAQSVSWMKECVNIRGAAAKDLCARVRQKIDVPWQAAIDVFLLRDVPEWTSKVCGAIPNADKLSPDCLGALVSVAYNRGASFNTSGDRYKEMRQIRQHVAGNELDKVDDDIREMKRLWPTVRGLRDRRDAEAAMFERGVKSSSPAVDKPIAKTEPPPMVPKPKPNAAEHGSGAGPVIVGGGVASQAAHSGASPGTIIAIIVFSAIVGIALWFGVRWLRSRPTLARQKG